MREYSHTFQALLHMHVSVCVPAAVIYLYADEQSLRERESIVPARSNKTLTSVPLIQKQSPSRASGPCSICNGTCHTFDVEETWRHF